MEAQTISIFFLRWLKENTGHYRYQTDEARKLRAQIEQENLESQEDIEKFSRYYSEFVRLIERNPLNGTDVNGKEAAILAESFYYMFYPNNDNLFLPMQIYIDMGSVSTPQKAQALYDRMDHSLQLWIKDAALQKKKIKEEFYSGSLQIAAIYGKLLNRKISSGGFWIRQVLLLILILLCGAQMVSGITDRIWLGGVTVNTIAFLVCSFLTVLFLIKSVIWICCEGRRKKLLLKWKHCAVHASEQQRKMASGFRNAATFLEIMKREILQAGSGPRKEPAKEELEGELEDSVDSSLFLQKKNIRICNTVRPVHIVLMTLVFLCITMASPTPVIRQLEHPFSMAREEIHTLLVKYGLDVKVMAEMEEAVMEDVSGEAGLMIPTGEWVDIYPNAQDDTVEEIPVDGKPLYVEGSAYNNNTGELMYAVTSQEGITGYVKADGCTLQEMQELSFGNMSLTDENGNVKNNSELGRLTDGNAGVSCELNKGDIIQIDYPSGCRFRYLYLINGSAGYEGSFELAGRAKKIRVVFDDSKEYYFTLPDENEPLGTYIRVPDIAASCVKLQVVEMYGEKESGGSLRLSELKLCGMRMG
ncbi:MAG: hypothetical protein SOX32_09225 [Candidatus Choladocola sp.]|nr:hypothetical protein [Candidatus Choladocola sp.]